MSLTCCCNPCYHVYFLQLSEEESERRSNGPLGQTTGFDIYSYAECMLTDVSPLRERLRARIIPGGCCFAIYCGIQILLQIIILGLIWSHLGIAISISSIILHVFMLIARFCCVGRKHHFYVRGFFHICYDTFLFLAVNIVGIEVDSAYRESEAMVIRQFSLALLLFNLICLLPRCDCCERFYPKERNDFRLQGRRCHIMTSDDKGDTYGKYLSHHNQTLTLRGSEANGLNEVWKINAADDHEFPNNMGLIYYRFQTSDVDKDLWLHKLPTYITLSLHHTETKWGLWEVNQKFQRQKSTVEFIYRRKEDYHEKYYLCHNADGQVMLRSELKLSDDICTTWKMIDLDPRN